MAMITITELKRLARGRIKSRENAKGRLNNGYIKGGNRRKTRRSPKRHKNSPPSNNSRQQISPIVPANSQPEAQPAGREGSNSNT